MYFYFLLLFVCGWWNVQQARGILYILHSTVCTHILRIFFRCDFTYHNKYVHYRTCDSNEQQPRSTTFGAPWNFFFGQILNNLNPQGSSNTLMRLDWMWYWEPGVNYIYTNNIECLLLELIINKYYRMSMYVEAC